MAKENARNPCKATSKVRWKTQETRAKPRQKREGKRKKPVQSHVKVSIPEYSF